ncbi:MAG: hypothetical protein AB7S50_06060 [Bacteroidales bacterium]
MKQILTFFILVLTVIFSSCLNDLPETISSDVEINTALAFPIGETSLELNDISGFDESLLEINPLTNKPYLFDFENIPLDYTIPFEIGDIYESAEEIVQLIFRLNMYNGFPSEVRVQLYFLDQNEFPVDSVFSDGPLHLNAATANNTGVIIRKTYSKKDILFNTQRIENLQYANKIKVYAIFSTDGIDPDLVELYDEYTIDVQIGVKANLRFNP